MKTIIFDLDGTLLDVRRGFYWQFQELTRFYDGVAVSETAVNAAAHGTTEQIVRTLVKNDKVPFAEICLYHRQLRLEAYDRYLKLYDGVDELLPILRRMGYKVAALTSGNQLTVDCLTRTGIHRHFDIIVDASRVHNPKPHPEGILVIMKELKADPADIIMIGDTPTDILVGKNAGVAKTVGVSHGFGSVDMLHAAGADHVVHDISSILDVLE